MALLCLVAPEARAQLGLSSHVVTPAWSADGPVMVGSSLSLPARRVGIRLGFGVDAQATPLASLLDLERRRWVEDWQAEADALIYPTSDPTGHLFAPYLLMGTALHGRHTRELVPEVVTTRYGAGLQVNLGRHLSVEGEGWYQTPLVVLDPMAEAEAGWAYRVGLSLRVGGGRKAVKPRPTGRSARPEPRYVPPPMPEVPVETPRPPSRGTQASGRAPAIAAHAIATGDNYLGTKYVWGGTSPGRGFDCSGFVQYVYRHHGIDLPRVSRDQARAGVALPADLSVLRPGDLMFFASNGRRIDHVAIYTGNGQILHSSKGRGGVAYDDLWGRGGAWYRQRFIAARRVLPDAPVHADADVSVSDNNKRLNW